MRKAQVAVLAAAIGLGIWGFQTPASAFETTVTYSDNSASTGPVSFGILPEDFPDQIDVVINVAGVGTSPGVFDETDLISIDFQLGDLTLTEADIADFEMEIAQVTRIGEIGVTVLNYSFNPVDTATATNIIIFNNSFELTITGTDDTNGPFNYNWAESTQVLDTPGPVININIKPGSDPNSINTCSRGATPVAIFGSDTVDVESLDLDQLMLASAMVRTVGRSDRSLCSISDIGAPGSAVDFFDGYDELLDGNLDVVCHFVTYELMDDPSSFAELQMVGCDDPNDMDGCQPSDAGYFTAAATDAVNIVKDCN